VRTTVDAERLKNQAAELQAVLADAGSRANVTASQIADRAKEQATYARDWATPHVEHGVDWARPRVEKAWTESKAKAGPHVEKAAQKAVPVVDTAHDKLVDDLLPKVVAAVNAAAVATAAGADKARDVTSTKLAELGHIDPPKRSRKGRKFFWFLLLAGGLGAAYQAWRRSGPTTDPWAEDPWDSAAEDSFRNRAAEARDEFQGVVDDVRHELEDRAEAVGEAAGEAVARTREATEKAAERAREATEKATERARKSGGRRKASESDNTSDDTTTVSTSSDAADDTTTTQALPSVDATPADVADTIGTQLEDTPGGSGEGRTS
jgi:colicin import membrane protein